MKRWCFEKYIIDKKVNGYYLWERTGLFEYTEILSGVDSLLNFFVEDKLNEMAEHVMSKTQARAIGRKTRDSYASSFRTHINMTTDQVEENGFDFDYGTYEDFIAEFTKQELSEAGWNKNPLYTESFFAFNVESKIHASLIMFNGTYMIMKTVVDFIKVKEFLEENKLMPESEGQLIKKWSE